MIRVAWSLPAADAAEPAAIAERVAESKLAGIDLSAVNANAALATGQQLVAANVPVICLATTATLPTRLGSESAWLDPTRQWVLAAAELGADTLRLHVTHELSARNRPSPVRLAEQLAALAELARQQQVRIVLETRGEFAQSADLWRVLELCASENLSACCSLNGEEASATSGKTQLKFGDTSPNTISVLNLRIRYVHIRVALRAATTTPLPVQKSAESGARELSGETDPNGATPSPRGSINAGAISMLRHLRGIGYDGMVALASDSESIANVAESVQKIISPPKAKPAPAVAHKK